MKKHRISGKPTSDYDKLKRRKNYEEKQREIRRKKKLRKVISTKAKKKRKKTGQISACPECGDFHTKKSDVCKVREMKVKMIVQQIMTHSESIKVNNNIINFPQSKLYCSRKI